MTKTTKGPSKKLKFEKYNQYGYYFLIPFMVGFLLFQLYPIIYTFQISFTSMNNWQTLETTTNVGLGNFVTLLTKTPLFIQSLQNTFLLWGLNFIPQILMALKGSSFFKTVFYLPNMIMAASVAVLFMILFSNP